MLQRLSLVLLFAIAAVVAAALALGAYLNYGSVKAAYLTQVDSRLKAIGSGIVDDIEISISFGIPVAGQETLGPLLERERGIDPTIYAIDVLGPDGTILHSSDEARVGENLPMLDDQSQRLALPVLNDFGGEEGSVRIIANQEALDANLDGTAIEVRNAAIYSLLASLALAVASLALLLSGAQRRAQEANHLAGADQETGASWAFLDVDREQAAIEERLKALEAGPEKEKA
ncbi:MAG: hypothetical protein RIC87_16035 [Kiloniellales bacterium]